jgi:RimJ/RimL family protein N-acetyltransferase
MTQVDHQPRAPSELRTARLLLRPLRASDIDGFAVMCADADVMRYLGAGPLHLEDAWRQLAFFVGHWELRGFGMWAVEELASSAFVGRVGLHYPEGWPSREVGWVLARPFWGRGYALEAAQAALAVAFDGLGWSHASSFIAPGNLRSIRLAERLGERFKSEVEVRGHRVREYRLERQRGRVE